MAFCLLSLCFPVDFFGQTETKQTSAITRREKRFNRKAQPGLILSYTVTTLPLYATLEETLPVEQIIHQQSHACSGIHSNFFVNILERNVR